MDNKAIKQEEYRRLSTLLDVIVTFVKKHPKLTYIEFDYFVVHQMTLFTIEPNYDFETLESNIRLIKNALPAMKRIFAKPIIVLRDGSEVLPVENVRTINQETLLHLANHSHNVANIKNKVIMPRKLLTRVYEDDYSIYENIIFCNFIDQVNSYIRKSKRILANLLYVNEVMNFNLLEKTNHLNYYLALGKLHTGYIRDYSQYFMLAKRELIELNLIQATIQTNLKRTVYQKNLRRNGNLALKKTNIFLSQKDYKQVYKTYKYMINNVIPTISDNVNYDVSLLTNNYLLFLQVLIVFAVGHLNFKIDETIKISIGKLNNTFSFKDWQLTIKYQANGILLSFKKDINYTILLVADLSFDSNFSYEDSKVNEVIVCSPFYKNYQERDKLFLSMEDVESFRRCQQIVLKGMIYSDLKYSICPFCSQKLNHNDKGSYYHCDNCMLEIKKAICKDNGSEYFYTTLANFDYKINDANWNFDKQIEGQMYFRNITKIDGRGNIVCPKCNKVGCER